VIKQLILPAWALLLCCGCAATETAKKPAQTAPPGATSPAPASATPVSTPRQSAPPPPANPSPATPLRPEVSADEEHRLVESTKQSIGDIARAVAELEGRQMKPPQQEALRTAKNFLDQARSALDQRDYQRAANLASKARALTDDVVGTTK
jgi:hypothetical protein